MRTWRLKLITLIATTAVLTGCNAFRAEVGVGPGVFTEIKVPGLLHDGLAFHAMRFTGHDYARGWHGLDSSEDRRHSTASFFYHTSSEAEGYLPEDADLHQCMAVVPWAFDLMFDRPTTQSWELEVDVYALLVGFRLGFNPWFLFNDVERPPERVE